MTAAPGQVVKATNDAEAQIAKAITAAMREMGKRAAAAASANVHGAGFVSSKWDIRAKNFPPSGDSLTPAVWIHSRSNFEDVFETGRTITGNLWLPLPTVPLWPGDPTRQMSPRKYMQSVGPLIKVKRRGKTPVLGALVLGSLPPQPFGRFVSLRRLRRQIGAGPRTFVPLFVGVSAVTIEKRFDIEATVERIAAELPGLYVENENK